MWIINIAFLPLVFGFVISCCTTPFTIRLARKMGFVDDPSKHKHPAIIHKKPIPRLGGLPIFFATAIGVFVFAFPGKIFLLLLVASFLVFLVGALDDKYDLSPYVRFAANIFSALIVVLGGVKIPFITNPLGGILTFESLNISFLNISFAASAIFAVFWIVWVMNMLNWSKGVDGQMPGVAAVALFVIGIASLRFPNIDIENIATARIAFLLAGASLGFLIFNFYPAKIFPGYSATVLGFILGVLSILSGVKLATAVLVMGIPMVDGIFTIARRIASKRSPFWHDRQHLHHLLLDLGLSQRTIAVFYWFMSVVLGALSLSLSSKGKLFALILVIIVVVGFILTLRFLTKKENNT